MDKRYICGVVDGIFYYLFICFLSAKAFRLQICLHTKHSIKNYFKCEN